MCYSHIAEFICWQTVATVIPSLLHVTSPLSFHHYDDIIMTTIASQITSLTGVYSTVYSDADQRKHQSSGSLAFVGGIHRDRWIPRTKGQLRGKCFHLMTSSCDDFIRWKHFSRYWPSVWGIHRSPVNSPHKGQWRGALMFSLICALINNCVNNHEAGDLRRHRAHCDVSVMHSYIRIHIGINHTSI